MVDFPAYELYTDQLRRGAIRIKGRDGDEAVQLRVCVDKDRRVKDVQRVGAV